MHGPRAQPGSSGAAPPGRAEVAALDWAAADRAEATARLKQQAFDYVLAADCCYVDPGQGHRRSGTTEDAWTCPPSSHEEWIVLNNVTAGRLGVEADTCAFQAGRRLTRSSSWPLQRSWPAPTPSC